MAEICALFGDHTGAATANQALKSKMAVGRVMTCLQPVMFLSQGSSRGLAKSGTKFIMSVRRRELSFAAAASTVPPDGVAIETTNISRMIAPFEEQGRAVRLEWRGVHFSPLTTSKLPLHSGEVAEWSTNLSGTN